ncbi:MAG TPA: hypothetical protein VFZ09_01180 [Archangium sp.]|uniref:hypothetical protein n=1 Tax=Archangium sp. TaxID=1872627 RepID=UPI002E370D3F|nr:hypothetical protein [Archangium sp.]HEX5744821.1 hypothetical protein [Archangium sp.]
MSSDTQTSNTPVPTNDAVSKTKRRAPVVIIERGAELNPIQDAIRGVAFGAGFSVAFLFIAGCAWRAHQAEAGQ